MQCIPFEDGWINIFDGNKYYHSNGQLALHRLNGPAIEHADINCQQYYVGGIFCNNFISYIKAVIEYKKSS